MPTEIDAIIRVVEGLPLKEALALLASKRILEFASEGLEKLKKIIQDKYNESRYAFVPDKEEAQKLTQFSTNPNYRDVQLLVPNYEYIDLIRTGLLIDFYHKRDGSGDRERVLKIKEQIYRRPHSGYLLKIVKLPGTPFFSVILEYIHDLKRHNYSENQIKEAFSEIIDLWETSSKFFDIYDKEDNIIDFCNKQVSESKPFFFVLGMRTVAKTVEKAIEKLATEKVFEKNNYDYKITKSIEGNHPRVEVRVIRKAF